MGEWEYVDLEVTYVSTFEVQAIATVLTPEGSIYSFGCRYDAVKGKFKHLGRELPELLLSTIEADLRLETDSHIGDSQTTRYGGN